MTPPNAIRRVGRHLRDYWGCYAAPVAIGAAGGIIGQEFGHWLEPSVNYNRLAADMHMAGVGTAIAAGGAYALGAADACFRAVKRRMTGTPNHFRPDMLPAYALYSLGIGTGVYSGAMAYLYGVGGNTPHDVADAVRLGTLGTIIGTGAGAAGAIVAGAGAIAGETLYEGGKALRKKFSRERNTRPLSLEAECRQRGEAAVREQREEQAGNYLARYEETGDLRYLQLFEQMLERVDEESSSKG